jgi:hypothetical protein
MCWQNLFPGFSHKIRQNTVRQLAANCCIMPKMTPPSCQALSQGMNCGCMVMTLRQTNVVAMEDAVVTSAEESEASLVKCQDNADHFAKIENIYLANVITLIKVIQLGLNFCP